MSKPPPDFPPPLFREEEITPAAPIVALVLIAMAVVLYRFLCS